MTETHLLKLTSDRYIASYAPKYGQRVEIVRGMSCVMDFQMKKQEKPAGMSVTARGV